MSASTVVRSILGIVALLFSLLRLAKQQQWSEGVTATILLVLIVVLLAIAYQVRRKADKASVLNQIAENKPKKLRTLTVVYLGGIAVALAFMGYKLSDAALNVRRLEVAEKSWPTVDATIVAIAVRSSTNKSGDVIWSPFWTYSYAVGGQRYLSQSNVIPGGYYAHWYPSKKPAEEEASSRAVGHSVPAYYDRCRSTAIRAGPQDTKCQ